MSTPGSEAWAREVFGAPCVQPIVTILFCGRRVTVNKKAARHFKRLALIFQDKSPAYARQIDDFMDDWGYNCRKIAGTDVYSNHAFGLAIDIDATRNARNGGSYEESAMWREARPAILKAEKEGFRWGGRYSNPDEMHFETIASPQQIRRWFKRSGKLKRAARRRLKRFGKLV